MSLVLESHDETYYQASDRIPMIMFIIKFSIGFHYVAYYWASGRMHFLKHVIETLYRLRNIRPITRPLLGFAL